MAKFWRHYHNHNYNYALEYCEIRNTGTYAVCGISIDERFGVEVSFLERAVDDYDRDYGPVVRINPNAFSGKTGITSVIIPDSVTSIGKRAFSGCKSLEDVQFGGNVTKIDDGAFEGTGLTTTPWAENNDTIRSLGEFVFHNCAELNTAYIPNEIDKISDGAFDSCGSLTTVINNNGRDLTSIGNSAFRNCINLTINGIAIPDSVTNIGDRAFEGCTGLNGVLDLSRIRDNRHTKLAIGNLAFKGCRNLRSINVNKRNTTIGAGAFEGCVSLGTISGEEGEIASLGYRSFRNCGNLERITTPLNLRFIGDEAFDGCDNLIGYIGYGEDGQYSVNQVERNGIIGVVDEIEKFMHVYDVDEFSRYHAYDHVHEKFCKYIHELKNGRLSSEESERLFDELRLSHYLHTFLASWGMLRGSSFLLNKDYKFLKRVCEIVCEERFHWLLDVNPFDFRDDDPEKNSMRYIHDILELKDEITYCFEDGGSYYKPGSAEIPIDSVTDTLVSKILLATLGCIPAYDTYVQEALGDLLGSAYKPITGESLGALLWFVTNYTENDGGGERDFKYFTEKYEKKRKGKRTYGGPDYSVMKYVDMALWGYGYRISGKDEDED